MINSGILFDVSFNLVILAFNVSISLDLVFIERRRNVLELDSVFGFLVNIFRGFNILCLR